MREHRISCSVTSSTFDGTQMQARIIPMNIYINEGGRNRSVKV